MTYDEVIEIASIGEDSKHQFKSDFSNPASLTAEIVAFCNSRGGYIFIGIDDDGNIVGLTRDRVSALNQMISNASSQMVHPPVNPITELLKVKDRFVLILQIEEGILKPYMDNNGVIWIKSGADKRKVTSREEIQRILQHSNLIHADEIRVREASLNKIDIAYFKKFYQNVFNEIYINADNEIPRILENMNLMKDGTLNIAGALLLAEEPNFLLPAFMVKAVSYPGIDIHVDTYIDSEDITGRIETQFKQAVAFISRNIHHIQAGQNVNSVGILEIPKVVIEEILANALIHRDYFYSSCVRIFIFEDRIEIINPGSLPENLTIDMMKYGVSCPRNNVLASFASKILVYRGLGNGVRRAIKEYPDIVFENDIEANQFKVIIKRISKAENIIIKNSDQKKTTRKRPKNNNMELSENDILILDLIKKEPKISRKKLSNVLKMSDSAVKWKLESLVEMGCIKRLGPKNGGVWEVR